MKKNNYDKYIEDIFVKTFKGHDVNPDQETWDKIVDELRKRKPEKTLYLRRKIALIISIVLTLCVLVLPLKHGNNPDLKSYIGYSESANWLLPNLQANNLSSKSQDSTVDQTRTLTNNLSCKESTTLSHESRHYISNLGPSEHGHHYPKPNTQGYDQITVKSRGHMDLKPKRTRLATLGSINLNLVSNPSYVMIDSTKTTANNTPTLKWAVSTNFRPFRVHPILSGNQEITSYRKKFDRTGSGLSKTLHVMYPISNKFWIYSGFGHETYSYWSSKKSGRIQEVLTDSVKAMNKKLDVFNYYFYRTDTIFNPEIIKSSYSYVQIPIGILYSLSLSDKWVVNIKNGVSVGKLLKSQFNTEYGVFNKSNTSNSYLKSTQFRLIGQSAVGLGYHTKQYVIGINPSISYSFNSSSKNLIVNEKHLFWGVEFGLSYYLPRK